MKTKKEKKFYLTEAEIELLQEASIYFHKNLSDTVGLIIKESSKVIRQKELEKKKNEGMDFAELLAISNQQNLDLKKQLEEFKQDTKREILNQNSVIQELKDHFENEGTTKNYTRIKELRNRVEKLEKGIFGKIFGS